MTKPKRAATILTVDLLSVVLKRKARTAAMKAYPEGHAGALSQWVRKLIMEALKSGAPGNRTPKEQVATTVLGPSLRPTPISDSDRMMPI